MKVSLVRNGYGQLKVTPGRAPQDPARRTPPGGDARRAAFVRADVLATLEREGPLSAEALHPLLRGAHVSTTAVDAALADLEAAGRVEQADDVWSIVPRG